MRSPSRRFAGWIAGGTLVGFGLAVCDGPAPAGWLAYLVIGFAAGIGCGWIWRQITGGAPARGLLAAFLLGLLLRLAVGSAWIQLLPTYGNDVVHHRQGFFFPDAFERDRSAWAIGRTETSLTDAFDSGKGDQYGTLLFLTATVYRVFGPQVDSTVLPTAVAAVFGALAVVFTWGFARRSFGGRVASISAWVIALYPEAIILGSQPMREPYIMAGTAAAFHGYACLGEGGSRAGAGWILAGSLLNLAISPPFGVATGLLIGLAWIWERGARRRSARWVAVGVGGLLLLAAVLTVRAWSGLPGSPSGPAGAVANWFSGVEFELHKLQLASGWIQDIFGRTPAWAHVPLATLYGMVQPFLPAALMDNSGVVLMRVVMVLRALGWFALLPILLYAPWTALRVTGWRSLATYLTVVALLSALLISYRFAGDQWDSPRYRAALLPVAAVLFGWAWESARRRRDFWLAWCYVLVGVETAVMSWWYAGRYYHFPRLSLYRTFAIAALSGAALFVGGLWYGRKHRST